MQDIVDKLLVRLLQAHADWNKMMDDLDDRGIEDRSDFGDIVTFVINQLGIPADTTTQVPEGDPAYFCRDWLDFGLEGWEDDPNGPADYLAWLKAEAAALLAEETVDGAPESTGNA
jgi:hypothetical protein